MDFELDELKREFLVEAEEKVREIERAFSAPRNPESIERMSYLAHQLKGSGGSYGFQRISTHAADLEQALETAAKEAPPDSLEAKIGGHVSQLRGEIEERTRELSASRA
ncbi:MAG: Hpt domain [Acidobacteriota bacterium]|nr:Hpt domain [Acidobacteriota bacterium]